MITLWSLPCLTSGLCIVRNWFEQRGIIIYAPIHQALANLPAHKNAAENWNTFSLLDQLQFSFIWSSLSALRSCWLWSNPHAGKHIQRYTVNVYTATLTITARHLWPACYHGNKQSSVQSYRYWSPSWLLETADLQHTEHKLFFSHVCVHILSSVPSELSLSMLLQGDGSLLSH